MNIGHQLESDLVHRSWGQPGWKADSYIDVKKTFHDAITRAINLHLSGRSFDGAALDNIIKAKERNGAPESSSLSYYKAISMATEPFAHKTVETQQKRYKEQSSSLTQGNSTLNYHSADELPTKELKKKKRKKRTKQKELERQRDSSSDSTLTTLTRETVRRSNNTLADIQAAATYDARQNNFSNSPARTTITYRGPTDIPLMNGAALLPKSGTFAEGLLDTNSQTVLINNLPSTISKNQFCDYVVGLCGKVVSIKITTNKGNASAKIKLASPENNELLISLLDGQPYGTQGTDYRVLSAMLD